MFAYDTGDTRNSYIGQPTTNIGNNFRDFTGTGYSPDGEWTSNPTSFTKTYYPNLITPIGPGGTLIEESGTAGYHHLSRYGGGGESGAHSLSCYIYPLVSGITDFCIGMLGDSGNNIQFNLDTKAITYGGGISNRNAFIKDVPGYPGWLRVGANIEGRGGGWVGCFGYSSYTSYTGTAGAKKAYITGIQYEYITQPTPFVAGTRSVTQGLLPLAGNSTLDLSNVSFDSNAQMTFDGTNDFIYTNNSTQLNPGSSPFTVETVFNCSNVSIGEGILYNKEDLYEAAIHSGNFQYAWQPHWNWDGDTSFPVTNNTWYHAVVTYDGTYQRMYKNGVEVYNRPQTGNIGTNSNVFSIGARGVNTNGGGGYSFFPGQIPITKIYNRALSAGEVRQNYLHYKTRFNLS